MTYKRQPFLLTHRYGCLRFNAKNPEEEQGVKEMKTDLVSKPAFPCYLIALIFICMLISIIFGMNVEEDYTIELLLHITSRLYKLKKRI
jgi:hypothetical protein